VVGIPIILDKRRHHVAWKFGAFKAKFKPFSPSALFYFTGGTEGGRLFTLASKTHLFLRLRLPDVCQFFQGAMFCGQ
jgi:hypothetical protein